MYKVRAGKSIMLMSDALYEKYAKMVMDAAKNYVSEDIPSSPSAKPRRCKKLSIEDIEKVAEKCNFNSVEHFPDTDL